MVKQSFPLSEVYGLLEPGPVVLLTTAHAGRTNVMTLSWLTMLDFEPPLLACVVSDDNDSFGLLKSSLECAINIPTVDLAEKVVACGNHTGADMDKFERFGLTPKPASKVAAPLIDECFANLECKVVDTDSVSKYCLFVLEVIQAWIAPDLKDPRTIHHQGHGYFRVAGERIHLNSKMK